MAASIYESVCKTIIVANMHDVTAATGLLTRVGEAVHAPPMAAVTQNIMEECAEESPLRAFFLHTGAIRS